MELPVSWQNALILRFGKTRGARCEWCRTRPRIPGVSCAIYPRQYCAGIGDSIAVVPVAMNNLAAVGGRITLGGMSTENDSI
jgi:hypothetical protein